MENSPRQEFLSKGIYPISNSNAVFIDPVRILNNSYSRFSVSPFRYYSRSFPTHANPSDIEREKKQEEQCQTKKKKKRKRKRNEYVLNQKEELAQQRHMEVRPFLSSAYEAFLKEPNFSSILCSLKNYSVHAGADILVDNQQENIDLVDNPGEMNPSFVELGKLWQAPLYEISLPSYVKEQSTKDNDEAAHKLDMKSTIPLFNTLIENKSNDDAIAECLGRQYIIPRCGSFLMSDMHRISQLVSASPSDRFNLILVDPPWENKSVHRRSIYPTLPNKYLFSIPMKQLVHPEGALVALWVTNREKLRTFVEKDLFPAWGVVYAASLYWLKVKEDGHIISSLDLAHHKPYECLLLGYIYKKGNDTGEKVIENMPPDKHVIISVPGDHSRKPPIGNLLSDYTPGPKPIKGLELFARELLAGWTSWGNEPLLFQHLRYFLDRSDQT